MLVVQHGLEWQSPAPAGSLEVGNVLQTGHRTEAQPGHGSDLGGDAEQLAQVRLPVERHPAHPPPLGRAGQPHVLDGQAHRVEPGIGDGVAPENMGGTATLVIRDHHRHAGFEDALDLDAGEALGAFGVERVCEEPALGLDVVPEGLACSGVGDEDEIPGLAQPHAGSAVGGPEDPGQHLAADGLAAELGPHVAPAMDDVIKPGCRRRRRRLGTGAERALERRRDGVHSPGPYYRPGRQPVSLAQVTDQPWAHDACSLVDAMRAGELTPTEALELSLAAIERSELNAFSYVDADAARAAAEKADLSLPFGGVPVGIKELEHVTGWPYTEGSLVFADRTSDHDDIHVERLRRAGAILVGQTTSSEFGGVNYTSTKLHGTTRNPWDPSRTPGGSSGGSAAAVAGGLVPVGSGGDGGGSIRIPAGYSGLFGLKSTYGRIPKGPHTHQTPHTVTLGCLSRSVRDTARWFDACNGYHPHDTFSLPRVGGWEAGLGTATDELGSKRAVVAVDLGVAVVHPAVADVVQAAAEALVADAGLELVDVAVVFPPALMEWAMSNLVTLAADLGEHYPACEPELTMEILLGMNVASHHYDLAMAASAERFRVEMHEAMARILDEVDFILCATNPDVAFAAEGPVPMTVGERDLVAEFGDVIRAGANTGVLTMPANFCGNPAVSIPVGAVEGLPVGMQVIGRHHEEPLLLELAALAERERPWPLTAPGAPR